MIEPKDILTWCFTVAALDFGVFGFLYSTFATAVIQADQENAVPPPITDCLQRICWAAVFVLIVLTVLAVITSLKAGIGITVWTDIAVRAITGCFVVLTGFSLFGLHNGFIMGLTTAHDLGLLNYWSWIRAYTRNRQEFIEVGKIVFRAISAVSGNPPPSPVDLELALTNALQGTTIFKKLCVVRRRSYARSDLYPLFALGLARYLLDNDWAEVIQP